MSLPPELAAFIGTPPKRRTRGTLVAGYAGNLSAPPSHKTTPAEDTMPRGVYPRKKKALTVEQIETTLKNGMKAREEQAAKAPTSPVRAKAQASPRKPTTSPRFGVFEDGTIELKLATCTGIIGTDDARALVGFLRRIGIDA